jgi:hypothetical protein
MKNLKDLLLISPDNTYVIPSLNDAWISGITDGEGCFTCSLLSNSSAFRFRYILTQKWEVNKIILLSILNLFYPVQGSIVSHHISNVWELRINGLKNCQGL